MSFKATKVLLTGATGFIGGRVVEVLARESKAHLRVLIRNFANASRIARFPIEMVPGDVTDEAAVRRAAQGCDLIIHAAVGVSGSERERWDSTVSGTVAVMKAALDVCVKRVVHISTISVYGLTSDGALTEESRRGRLPDAYSRSKAEAEVVALLYHRQHGLPVSVVQPTVVYGPFSQPWTHGPLASLRTSRVVLPNGGDGFCNAVYIDDVVAAILLAADRPEAVGECFLVSGEAPVTWKEFYGAYEEMLGASSTVGLTEGELRSLRRRDSWRSFFQAFARLSRTPEFHLCLRACAPARMMYNLVKRCLPQRTTEAIRNLGQSPENGLRPSESTERRIQFPSRDAFTWLAGKTSVRIDKAKRLLGYRPQFDLQRGMRTTREWAEWANLLGRR